MQTVATQNPEEAKGLLTQLSHNLKASLAFRHLFCSFLLRPSRAGARFSVSRVGVCVIPQLLLPISLFTAAAAADICSFGVGALLYSPRGASAIVCLSCERRVHAWQKSRLFKGKSPFYCDATPEKFLCTITRNNGELVSK